MRQWIVNALWYVIEKKEYSNLYLRNHLFEIESKDRGLATRIFYGTLQNHSFCRSVWKQYVKKEPSLYVCIVLDMSVYQLLFLDKVPKYAIVDQAVQIVKKKYPKQAGLVNAVLHKVKKEEIQYPENEMERLAYQTSCPLWLIKMWASQYSFSIAKEAAYSSNSILPVYVRKNVRMNQELSSDFKKVKEPIYMYSKEAITDTLEYKNGWVSVQDIGSYEIARFMDVQEGDTVLDCCGAPGTKTFAMAEYAKKASFLALDIHNHRVELMEKDKKRLKLANVETLCKDATKIDDLGYFDRILCDVPCSGYGVLSRKPDIKLRMNSSDMDTLIPLQYAILESASLHVKDKGILVYSTCTLNKKENEKQIARFIQNHPDFRILEEKTIYPSTSHDGFYMAKLQYDKTVV